MDGDRSMSEGYLTPEQLAAGLGQEPGGAYHREPDDGSLPRDPDAYCPRCHEPADIDCRCVGADYPERKDLPPRGTRHFFTNDPDPRERFISKPGDLEREPECVEYTVRDEQGRVVEIVTLDGQRIYVADDSEPAGPA
ncbi:MAG TPA: hypothetical protein VK488_03775 [Gaiellaceae bacterium]|nr:hypothetical protein [Gaiellaceae bacterium]